MYSDTDSFKLIPNVLRDSLIIFWLLSSSLLIDSVSLSLNVLLYLFLFKDSVTYSNLASFTAGIKTASNPSQLYVSGFTDSLPSKSVSKSPEPLDEMPMVEP